MAGPESPLTSRPPRADTRSMDQGMPPPPGSFEAWERVIAEPIAVPPRRPVAVTVAGVLLIVAGCFAALAAGLILLTGDGASIEGVGADASTVVVLAALALAALEVGAGALVLRCAPIGRTLGIGVAGLGIVGGLAAISSPQGIVTIAIFGFVIYTLVTNADAFRQTRAG
jgi:hypothetical protein